MSESRNETAGGQEASGGPLLRGHPPGALLPSAVPCLLCHLVLSLGLAKVLLYLGMQTPVPFLPGLSPRMGSIRSPDRITRPRDLRAHWAAIRWLLRPLSATLVKMPSATSNKTATLLAQTVKNMYYFTVIHKSQHRRLRHGVVH